MQIRNVQTVVADNVANELSITSDTTKQSVTIKGQLTFKCQKDLTTVTRTIREALNATLDVPSPESNPDE